MRKASAKISLKLFTDWLDEYKIILNNVISAKPNPFPRRQKLEIFEAFVPKICAEWDILVENLLVDCLNRNSERYSEYMMMRLPKHIPRNQCELMLSGIGYFDVQGVDQLKKISKRILVDRYNPFKGMTANQVKKIDEFFKIRNYVLHYSVKAERSLKKVYEENYKIRKFLEPGIFLMAVGNKKFPRLLSYIDNFENVAVTLAKALQIKL